MTWTRNDRLRPACAAIVLLVAVGGAPADAQGTKPDESAGTTAAEFPRDESPAPLRGLVLNTDGRPLPGATVTIRAIPADDDGKDVVLKPTVTRTGKDGRFSSDETVGNRFDVRVQAEGYAFRTLRQFVPTGPLNVTLDRGHVLAGRVLAETTGHGIAGVRVEIDDSEEFDLGAAAVETVTDDDGTYLFPHAPPGPVWVRATAPGWARRSLRGKVSPADDDGEPTVLDDLWLPKGGRLSGRVADTKGKPVAGASVIVAAVDLQRVGHRRPFPPMRTRTDEAGRYEFEGVTAGARYRVTAEHDRFSPAVTGPVAIDAGTVLGNVDLTLKAGAALRLRLVDKEDRPCTQVTMRIESEEDARTDLAFQQLIKSTENGGIVAGDDGWLTVRKLSPGSYSLRFEPDGWVGFRRDNVVLTEGETTDLRTIDLEPGSLMRGRVVDDGGNPVADAEVAVRWQVMADRYERRATSDPDGRFIIGGLPDHVLKLRASASEFAERNLEEVRPGSDDVVVTLVRRGGIRGTVKLAEGGIPSSFTVRTYAERGATAPSQKVETSAGSFEIRNLDPGAHSVEIRASGRAPGRLERVQVRPGSSTDVGEISLRPGLELEGRVVMADGGAAVAGASIRIDRGAGPSSWTQESGEFVAVSDAGGRFVFHELEAGRFTLTLFHSEFAPVQRSIDLDPAARKSEIEIGLTGGGEIRGVVIDSDGLPVAGADVVIYRGVRGFDLRMTSTAEDGSFHFPRLAAGTYIVMRNRSRARSPFNRQVRTVDVRQGQVMQVKFADGPD
jgi:uncharacterized GH25 family protein